MNLKEENEKLRGLLAEVRTTFEMWKDVAPAISLCADIDKALTQQEPAALSAVTAERDRLRELAYVGEHMHDDYSWKARHAELRAELDELCKDAERYRWLREQDAEDGIAVLPVGRWEMPALLCTTPFDSAEMVDAVVDAAMAAKEANKI